MTLAKLKIKPLDPSKLKEIEVLFNPTSYSITKSVTWDRPSSPTSTGDQNVTQRKLNAPILTFGGGGSRQLTLALFFDVTERIQGTKADDKVDVRDETSNIVALTRIERVKPEPKPPTCEISWGDAPNDLDFPFQGVVSSLTQNFTLFRSNGRPVRADLTVVFTEFLSQTKDQKKTDPELTTHLIKRGDTLSSIAADVYRDPTRWRIIATENNLDDPRQLSIGQLLTIPKM